jgi:hypothetical protein
MRRQGAAYELIGRNLACTPRQASAIKHILKISVSLKHSRRRRLEIGLGQLRFRQKVADACFRRVLPATWP